jgi:hypothetical protein
MIIITKLFCANLTLKGPNLIVDFFCVCFQITLKAKLLIFLSSYAPCQHGFLNDWHYKMLLIKIFFIQFLKLHKYFLQWNETQRESREIWFPEKAILRERLSIHGS